MEDETYVFPLTVRVPKSAFVIVAPEPATVTQHTVEQHFGIPPRLYRRMVKDGLFPVKRIGHLIFASYDDVRRAVTEGAVANARIERAKKKAVEQPNEVPMSVEEAIRQLESARTPRERRQRSKEISDLGWELALRYDRKLDDDSSNPAYDKELHDHGLRLVLAGAGLRPGVPVPPPERHGKR